MGALPGIAHEGTTDVSGHFSRRRPLRAVAITAVAACTAVLSPTGALGNVAEAAPTDGIIHATHDVWHMDETSGGTMTDSTGSHPGTLHSVTLGETGVSGKAYGFNRSYVAIPNAKDLNAYNRDVHIAFSMKTTTVPAVPDYDLFRKGEAGATPNYEYKVEMQPDGSVTCYFKGTLGSVTATSRPGLQDGQWHDIRCEKTSSSVVLTVDGVKTTKTKTIGSIYNGLDMIVGAYPNGDYYQGVMDEVSFTIDGDTVEPPTAAFTASPTSGSAPLDVDFTDTSTGGTPTSWSWDFGDGGSSGLANPSHTYEQPGSYPVKLTVKNSGGTSTTLPQTITVKDTNAPVGSFTVLPSSNAVAGSTTVTLQQQSLGDDFTPTSDITRKVDWGDGTGTVAWTTGTTTTHVFKTAGRFTPSVTLTDTAGNQRTVSTSTVSVTGTSSTVTPPGGARDKAAPSVWLLAPSNRSAVSGWRILRGKASDGSGSGVRYVTVKVIEKRGSSWFAYRTSTHSWVRATSKAAALRRASAARISLSSARFHERLYGLRKGLLEVRFKATDRAGNTSGTHLMTRRLVRP
jgi:PKD repeat protein